MAAPADDPLSALAREATKGAIDGKPLTPEELDRNIEQALACPCIDDLKSGPCGPAFVGAFSCFLRSQAAPPDPGGAAAPQCLATFEALQACMAQHPAAFADFVKGGGGGGGKEGA